MKRKWLSILLAFSLVCALMPTASLASEISKGYSDVDQSKWYVPYIDYVVEHELMIGTSGTKFSPNGQVTRAQFIQTLYALAEKPSVKQASSFTDLKNGAFYVNGVNWAAQVGVASGITKTTFAPNQKVTREQAATFFKAYAEKYLRFKCDESGDLSIFPDKTEASRFANEPLQWAVGANLITGVKQGKTVLLDPKGTLTRAQLATMLKSFDRYIKRYEPEKSTKPEETQTAQESSKPSNTSTQNSDVQDKAATETTNVTLVAEWLDEEGNEKVDSIPENISFTNGFTLGENVVHVGVEISISAEDLEEYDLKATTINGKQVESVNFTPLSGVEYTIVFIFQKDDLSRRPNKDTVTINKLVQLATDGYADFILHDDATIRAIDGEFTSIKVENKKDAVQVLKQLSPLFGLSSDSDEFSVDDIEHVTAGDDDLQRHFYRYYPSVKNIPVFGSEIILSVGKNGIPDGLNSSYSRKVNSVTTEPTITSDEAEVIVRNDFRRRLIDKMAEGDAEGKYKDQISQYAEQITSAVKVESTLLLYAVDSITPILTWGIRMYIPFDRENDGSSSSLFEISELNEQSLVLPPVDETYYVSADEATSKKIVNSLSNIEAIESSSDTAKDKNGNTRTINITVQDGKSYLLDRNRNIQTYQTMYQTSGGFLGLFQKTTAVLPGRLIEKRDNSWNKKGVSAHYNMSKAYDFYKNSLGRDSYDGKGTSVVSSIEHVDWEKNSELIWLIYAFNDPNAFWTRSNKQFVFNNSGNYESALDAVGHEYTHAVINTIVGGQSFDKQGYLNLIGKGESGALNEAYADIMGSLVEGKSRSDKNRWLVGEDSGKIVRSMSDPSKYGHPENYSKLERVKDKSKIDVHTYCGIFSLAFYKMVMDDDTCTTNTHNHTARTRSVSDETWAKIFYDSIYHLPVDAEFVDARFAVLVEARANGLDNQQIQAIKEAFDDVGIFAGDVSLAQDLFNWTWYEHPNYEFKYIYPQPEKREHSITITGKDIRMNGFNEEAYKDFLFSPNTANSKLLLSFDLVRDNTDWHSIEGGGFLFNTSIQDGKIEGYCILTTQTGLKLVRIDPCDLNQFRNGTYNQVQDAGKLLTTVDVGDPYAEQSYAIWIENNKISICCNGEWVVLNYELPDASDGYGFGPIVSHENHACEQLSYYTFSNIRMESLK